MADRYKPIFFAIISLTIIWFFIVLFYLPQNPDLDKQQQWSAISQPLSLERSENSPIRSTNTRQDIEYPANRNHNREHYPHKIPEYMKYFQFKRHRELNTLDIVFYQLNIHTTEENQINLNESADEMMLDPVPKEKHLRDTLELKSINSPTDRYVKSEGDRLFAFNLLVSNRIGSFRPLPDTRHAKCNTPKTLGQENTAEQESSTLAERHSFRQQSDDTTGSKSKVSIIICYYNEAPSALLRTIYSILKRTARKYMQEIIVVDDSSEAEYDITKVKPFINDPLIILTRTKKREGLIRARLFGSDMAKGQILLFLDSHVEPNYGWIEPLMEVVLSNKSTIACPVIDLINAETLIYTSSPLVKGGMNWALNFRWDSVPTDKLKTYDDFVRPIESPTMAGGLFAIDRDFFYHIGSYDPGMELWGGENIELSLRTWMCGGKIVILPCSRVGHIFRKRRPYGPGPNEPDSLLLNSHRVARVWLDHYIDRFYEANPDAKYLISGDVSKRLDLRHQLGCKNFSWFLENVYPDLIADKKKISAMVAGVGDSRAGLKTARSINSQRNIRSQRQVANPIQLIRVTGRENVMQPLLDSENDRIMGGPRSNSFLPRMLAQFQIQSKNSELCVESKRIHTAGQFTRLILSRCAKIERNDEGEILISNSTILDQIWTETELHDLRLGPNRCLDVFKNLPLLRKCHNMGSFQNWSHNSANLTSDTNIFNTRAGLCLGVERVQIDEPIIVTICDKKTYEGHNYTAAGSHAYQSWRWRQTAQLGFEPRNVAGWMRRPLEYHLNQTRPSHSWDLIIVNNSAANHVTFGGVT